MASCRSFLDRYFTRRYALDVRNKPMEDICLSFHSNGVCVLTLAPSHPVVGQSQTGITVKSVDYKVTGKVDRADNKVSGKSKRGAQNLAPDAPVCRIVCARGPEEVVFTIRACIKGRLIEVNERLITEPQLLVTHPETLGYICVIVQKRDWSRAEQAAEGSASQASNVNSISLIDRPSYLRLRFPDCEIAQDTPIGPSDVAEETDDG